MVWGAARRGRILDEQPFVDKQLLRGLALRPGIGYALRVKFNGTDYPVTIGWAAKGHGYCPMFRCPVHGRLVERLYLCGNQLVSRHVVALPYASQVRGKIDVIEFQADRLRRCLNDPLLTFPLWDGVPIPGKPKTMRWPIYWAKVSKLEKLQQGLTLLVQSRLAKLS